MCAVGHGNLRWPCKSVNHEGYSGPRRNACPGMVRVWAGPGVLRYEVRPVSAADNRSNQRETGLRAPLCPSWLPGFWVSSVVRFAYPDDHSGDKQDGEEDQNSRPHRRRDQYGDHQRNRRQGRTPQRFPRRFREFAFLPRAACRHHLHLRPAILASGHDARSSTNAFSFVIVCVLCG